MSRFVFMFSVVLPFQRYSTLFVTLECFAHKKNIYFFCATFHHCVQYRMCQWWQYMYIN